MIKSMTAFASTKVVEGGFSITTELRTYNSRHLDIVLRIPHSFLSLEEQIKTLISNWISRGRIEVMIQIRDESDPEYEIEVDTAKMRAYKKGLQELRTVFHIEDQLPTDFLMGSAGIIKFVEPEKNLEAVWPVLKQCLRSTLDDLNAMREKEGEFLAQDFISRLGFIQESLEQIRQSAEDLLPYYQERLKERIHTLTKGVVDIDPARIAQEAAFLADRSDISEEIVRVDSHLNQFRNIMESKEPVGRKLNFLLQEFNREFNTMGAKAGNAQVSHTIVSVKSELEKIREQVQNVE
jgi:uncharacterized protein (TIGR00255 family)